MFQLLAFGPGPVPAGRQMDFDCAESKLDGYRVWVEAVRQEVAPVPVTITALPAWLGRPAFARLAAAADGYVLQVHSLARPTGAAAPFTLCAPEAARRAVEQAARLGRPFRVALPTYGCRVAFDARGRFAGLSAEGPETAWPEGFTVREVRADPEAMAGLVHGWLTNRPAALQGVIWYRLPVAGDRLNWPWPTLAAVMRGRAPRPALRALARQPRPGLVEVDLVNQGAAAASPPASITVRWAGARLIAADAVHGFDLAQEAPDRVRFHRAATPARLDPAERRTVGWIRLDRETEVTVETELQSLNAEAGNESP